MLFSRFLEQPSRLSASYQVRHAGMRFYTTMVMHSVQPSLVWSGLVWSGLQYLSEWHQGILGCLPDPARALRGSQCGPPPVSPLPGMPAQMQRPLADHHQKSSGPATRQETTLKGVQSETGQSAHVGASRGTGHHQLSCLTRPSSMKPYLMSQPNCKPLIYPALPSSQWFK